MLIPITELIKKYGFKPTGIIHCGGHWGEEAKDYFDNDFNPVIWIEADPKCYAEMKEHLKAFPNQLAALACIGDEDGKEVTFNVASNTGQSSSYLELGTHATVHPEVIYVDTFQTKTVRLDTFLTANNVNLDKYKLLVCDLQGAELFALKGMGELLHKMDYLYLEVNKAELYVGCALIEEIDDYVAQYGFKRVVTEWAGNTNWGDAAYVKN